MQATSSTYRPPAGGDWLTTSSLILIVILAVITLAAIIYGMRLSAQRRAARLAEEQRVAAESVPDTAPEPIAPAIETAHPEDTRPAPAADPLPVTPDLLDEPIAATAPLVASPAVEAEPAPAADVRRQADDRPLTILKGLGPKVATRLDDFGLRTVGDLAALDDAQAESIDARMGPFTGRMARDRWLEQARLLAAGDVATFEAQFGRLDAPRG